MINGIVASNRIIRNTNIDPYFSNVSFLLDLNKPVGSTTFTDIANPSRVISTNLVAYSNINQNNGENTLLFDGSNNFLSAASSDAVAFGLNPFTLEFVLRVDSYQSGYAVVMDNRTGYYGYGSSTLMAQASGVIAVSGESQTPQSPIGLTPINEYFRLVMAFDGVQNNFYVNESLVWVTTQTVGNKTEKPIVLGKFYDNGAGMRMNLSKVRFTKNIARLPNSFIPLSGPVPLN